MRLLLDSHFAMWVALDPAQMTNAERALLSRPDTIIAVSAVSLWELRIKWEKRFVSGERKGAASPADVLSVLRARRIPVEPLDPVHAVARLDAHASNKDPFDEQLLIHAQETGMKLLTRDMALMGHPCVFRLVA